MRHNDVVDVVRIESDENGFHLIVETIDGDYFDFKLPSYQAKILAFQETLPIRLHWEEGMAARVEQLAIKGDYGEKSALRLELDLIEEKVQDDLDFARDIERGK